MFLVGTIKYNYCIIYLQGILKILEIDNQIMEIPMFLRDSLELDLASMLSLGKFTASRDMLLHIHTMNAIRRASVTSDEIILLPPEDYVTKIKFNMRGPDIFIKVSYISY